MAPAHPLPPLSPLCEEPDGYQVAGSRKRRRKSLVPGSLSSFHRWARDHLWLPFLSASRSGDLRILLAILSSPLSPMPVSALLPCNVSTSAQYILQQFRATAGCDKIAAKSMYVAGHVRLLMLREPGAAPVSAARRHDGCFVFWQLVPGMWLFELAVARRHVAASSDGHVVWRRTPWQRAHAARGGPRPLRRVLQGLDPITIAAVFSGAEHIGEKRVEDDECFVLKLDVSRAVLSSWSDNTAEIIRHRMVGYFSQRSGLLVRLEDSQLTRIQPLGSPAMFWEATTVSTMWDYRPVDGGVLVAHAGRSTAYLARFGVRDKAVKCGVVAAQMEEEWAIDDVAFNVPGLSADAFIPPEEIKVSGSATPCKADDL